MREGVDISWNHRIIHREHGPAFGEYGLHEVYYDEAGAPISCTEEPVRVLAGDVDELRADLEHMMEALDKPVLEWADLPGEEIAS